MKQYNNYADLITFTRASSGTALRPISYGDELVSNGTFDSDSDWIKQTGWSISGGTANWNGVASVYLQQANVFTPNTLYTITFTISNNTSGTISIRDGAAAVLVPNTTYANGTYSFNVVSTSNSSIRIYGVGGSGSLSIDNISVREVLFDQPNAPLTLFNHPTNIPRIEYDADGNRLGLLVEESRTNLITYSEDFEDDSWAGYWQKPTFTTGQLAPDGSYTAMKWNASTTTGSGTGTRGGLVYGQNLATTGIDYTASVWMKSSASISVLFGLDDGVNEEIFLTEQWVRYTFTGQTGATNRRLFQIIEQTNADVDIYIWGAQTEQASFPTSYIPTSGSTATRSVDVASIGVSEFGYNQAEGTVFVEFNRSGYSTVNNSSVIYGGAANARWIYSTINSTANYSYDGTNSLNHGNIPAGSDTKLAMSVDQATQNSSYNGATVVSATHNGNIASQTNKFNIGHNHNVADFYSGHIKSIKYYPRALTADQLEALTS